MILIYIINNKRKINLNNEKTNKEKISKEIKKKDK